MKLPSLYNRTPVVGTKLTLVPSNVAPQRGCCSKSAKKVSPTRNHHPFSSRILFKILVHFSGSRQDTCLSSPHISCTFRHRAKQPQPAKHQITRTPRSQPYIRRSKSIPVRSMQTTYHTAGRNRGLAGV